MQSALNLTKEQIREAFRLAYHNNVSTYRFITKRYKLEGIETCVLREIAHIAYFFAMGVLTSKKPEIVDFMAYHLDVTPKVAESMYTQAATDCLANNTTPVQQYNTPIIP